MYDFIVNYFEIKPVNHVCIWKKKYSNFFVNKFLFFTWKLWAYPLQVPVFWVC